MIILQGITVDEFFSRLKQTIKLTLDEQKPKESPKKPRLLTRKEVAEYLRVSLPTLHEWTKQGNIQSYRIGNRVYYKSSEIEVAIIHRKYRSHS